MGHIAKFGDSPWVAAGDFLGSRGQSLGLEGFAARLRGPGIDIYDVFYQVRTGKEEWSAIFKNGQYAGTRSKEKSITGLKIWLNLKPN